MSRAKWMVSWIVCLRLPGQAEDERAVYRDAEVAAVCGELRWPRSTRSPFLMLLRICWLPDSKPTSSSRRPFSCMTLSGLAGHVRLGVARPGDAELPEARGRYPRPRGRSSVNVSSSKKNSFTCGNSFLAQGHLRRRRCSDAANAVPVAADRLRPQAEGAPANGSRGPCRATYRDAAGSRCSSSRSAGRACRRSTRTEARPCPSSSAQSGLCRGCPPGSLYDRPATSASGLPSATSLRVKSNSSLATKSIAGEASSDRSGATATVGQARPINREGAASLSASATLTSPAKVGELV